MFEISERPLPQLTPLEVLRPERVARVILHSGEHAVLKRIPKRYRFENVALAGFAFEILALKRLATEAPEFVAALLDAGTDARGPWMLTRFVDAAPLTVWQGHGPMDGTTDAAFVAYRRAQAALDAVHAAHIIHGDISPDNLLLDETRAVLVDFDLGRDARGDTGPYAAVRGTLTCAAPSVLRGEPPTPASDRFALAASFIAAISGRPFRDASRGPAALIAEADVLPPLPDHLFSVNFGVELHRALRSTDG